MADKLAAERERAEHDEAIRIDATNRANQAAEAAVEREKSKVAHAAAVEERDAEDRRKDEVNNRLVRRAIYSGFINAGLTGDAAKLATQALIDSAIPHTTINY